MPAVTLQVILQDVRKVESDAIVVGFFEDVRPLKGYAGHVDWLLCGALSDLLIEKKLRGSVGEVALLTNRKKVPAQKIFMVGLGPLAEYSLQALKHASRCAAASILGSGAARAAIEYVHPHDASYDASLPALREGLNEGAIGRNLAVSLLAPDAAAYDQLSRLVK